MNNKYLPILMLVIDSTLIGCTPTNVQPATQPIAKETSAPISPEEEQELKDFADILSCEIMFLGLDDAEKRTRKFANDNPKSNMAKICLAKVLNTNKKYSEAHELTSAVLLNITNKSISNIVAKTLPRAYITHAVTLAGLQQFAEAKKFISKASEYSNEHGVYAEISFYQAKIYGLQNKPEQAIAYLQQKYALATQREKDSWYGIESLALLGEYYLALDKNNEAKEVLENYLSINSKDRISGSLSVAYVSFNLAQVYGRLGNEQRAIENYSTAIKLAPQFPKALEYRGNLYLNSKKYTEALKDFNAVLTMMPNSFMPLYHRAVLQCMNGNYKDGREDLQVVFQLKPNDKDEQDALIDAQNILSSKKCGGQVQERANNFDREQETILAEGMRLKKSGNLLQALSEYDKVITNYQQQYHNSSEKIYSALNQEDARWYLQDNPKQKIRIVSGAWTYSYILKSLVLVELERLVEAKTSLASAIQLAPNNSQARSILASIYKKEAQWSQAIGVAQEAEMLAIYSLNSTQNDDLVNAWHHQGYILTEQGRLDDAVKTYTKCIEFNQNDATALKELEFIRLVKEKQVVGKNTNTFESLALLEPVKAIATPIAVEKLTQLQNLAQAGDVKAQLYLADMYFWGKGVDKNEANSFEWDQKAAVQGSAKAQNAIGYMYNTGTVVAKDYAKAVEWYRKAAAQGYAIAENNIAFSYRDGTGVTKDENIALEWHLKAAKSGNTKAAYPIAKAYYEGKFISKNIVYSYAWLVLSITQQGFTDSNKTLLGQLENELTVAQRQEGDHLAREWRTLLKVSA